MNVSAQQADRILSQTNTDYVTFQRGKTKHWRTYTDKNGQAHATKQSICWLFCWAATGRGSREAERQARQAFDRIFDPPYDSPSQQLTLEEARKCRY